MKPITQLLIMLFATVCLYSCQKQPKANFTTDKDTYTAGDTVHLMDASTNAYHWKWMLPDGTINNGSNVDYIIDINAIDSIENITLVVSSKHNRKAASLKKTIAIKQAILPTDYFSFGINGTKVIPISKKAYAKNGKWVIVADFYTTRSYIKDYVSIYLPGPFRPTISSVADIQLGNASASHYRSSTDFWSVATSISGQVNVEVLNKGQTHLSFSNVNVKYVSNSLGLMDTSYSIMSGDITCY